MCHSGRSVFAVAALLPLLMACGGAVAPTESTDQPSGPAGGANPSQLGSGAPATAPQPLQPPTLPPSPETEAVAAARSLLVGRSFHAVELDIGGSPFGTAPPNYREAIVGELMKICFGTGDAVTVCECDNPVFASVDDIAPNGHPTDHCTSGLVCRGGKYGFNAEGRLRLDVPNTTLTWALQEAGAEPDAGEVAGVSEGTYVRSLIGLGDTLLAPTDGCP